MLHAKEAVRLHNRFDIQLIDTTTGKVKKIAQAENTALDLFYTFLGDRFRIPVALYMGTGTGTPSPSDAGLFKQAFGTSTYSNSSGVELISRIIEQPTSKLIYSVTFPATSDYVGNLTEIGVWSNRGIITHAMLSDSEGNPIAINKTELDTLIVTVTLYLTFDNKASGFTPVFPNKFTDALNIGPNGTLPYVWGNLELYRCANSHNASGNFVVPGGAYKVSAYDAPTRTCRLTGTRLTTEQGNGTFGATYYNAIGISGNGYMRFPNTAVFPYYRVSDIPVGVGDGSTQDFTSPFALFVSNSDIVYKNGVELIRDTDYTISNVSYLPTSPCVTAGNFANVTMDYEIWSSSSSDGKYQNVTPFSLNKVNYKCVPIDKTALPTNLEVKIDMSSDGYVDTNIGRKVDGFYVPVFIEAQSTSRVDNVTFGVKLEYSTDGNIWQEVPVTLSQQHIGTGNLSAYYFLAFGLTGSFDEIDANYIKLTISLLTMPDLSSGIYRFLAFGEALDSSWIGNRPSALYKKGSPIHFNQAPADGDVITMSVELDRPYKSTNYVLDATMAITLE